MNQNQKQLKIGLIVLGSILFLAGIIWQGSLVFGSITTQTSLGGQREIKEFTFFATTTSAVQSWHSTTTSATSTDITSFVDDQGAIDRGYFVIAGARRVTFFFSRGDTSGQGNSGSTRFEVDVSDDGTTWTPFNGLILNNVSAGSVTRPHVGTSTISAATSTSVAEMDLVNQAIYAVRCRVIETTDGEHTCKALAEWQ